MTRNQELWLYQATAMVSPRDPKKALIGAVIRYRFDVKIMSDWVHAGEFVTNDVYKNPTTGEQGVNHVQPLSLQYLNDIITVSNQTKINNRTGQKLLTPFTEEQVMEYAHQNRELISPEDAAFFVGNLVK